jgi:hypothetical protein
VLPAASTAKPSAAARTAVTTNRRNYDAGARKTSRRDRA